MLGVLQETAVIYKRQRNNARTNKVRINRIKTGVDMLAENEYVDRNDMHLCIYVQYNIQICSHNSLCIYTRLYRLCFGGSLVSFLMMTVMMMMMERAILGLEKTLEESIPITDFWQILPRAPLPNLAPDWQTNQENLRVPGAHISYFVRRCPPH